MGEFRREPDWIVDDKGQARRPDQNNNTYSFVDPGEFISSDPSDEDFLSNHEINRLIKEGKITIIEAESIRQQTKNMNPLERHTLFSAINDRVETTKKESSTVKDSLLKQYGINPNKFKL